jgi:ATP-binding cassette subfamily B protein
MQLSTYQVYRRALGLLAEEHALTVWVAASGIAVAMVQLAEPVLFGRVVDALSRGQEAFPIIGLWAALGLLGIVASVIVSIAADRLAHRRRLTALGQAFERAIILPISYHAEKGSGSVIRTILAGSDNLFWNWLSFLRHEYGHGPDSGGARGRLFVPEHPGGAQDERRAGGCRALP